MVFGHSAAKRMEIFSFIAKVSFIIFLLFGKPQIWCYITLNKWPYLFEFLKKYFLESIKRVRRIEDGYLILGMYRYQIDKVIRE